MGTVRRGCVDIGTVPRRGLRRLALAGTLAGAACTTGLPPPPGDAFTVGGTVHGLAGTGLVLDDGAGHRLALDGDGPFAFPDPVAAGARIAVTVAAQPIVPWQTCTVAGGDVPAIAADLTSLDVTCTTSRFAVGGTVTGLSGAGLVLEDGGGDDLAIAADGTFTFAATIASGQPFHVAIAAPPDQPGEACAVFGGDGTVGRGDVTSVLVRCSTGGFAVGGTVTGLAATGLVLERDGGDDLAVDADGGFAFAAPVPSGQPFHVTVAAAPRSPAQTCTVAGGDGVVGAGDVTTIAVTCATNRYAIGGTVTGLAGGTVVLENEGGDDLTITADGGFAFTTPVASGARFDVTVKTPPAAPPRTCWIADGAGIVGEHDVTRVAVVCRVPQPATQVGVATGGGCALRGGELWCWGRNDDGQVGDGTTEWRAVPVRIAAGTTWSALAVGGYHACAIRDDGSLWCWGFDEWGQLGDGATGYRTTPVEVVGAARWSQVAAGDGATCGIQIDGSLWCWGENSYGELGDGTTTDRSVPVPVAGGATWRMVTTSGGHTCGIQADGSLWCWGGNAWGQLGDGTTTSRATPVRIDDASTFSSVSAGGMRTCAIRSDATLWCWGDVSLGLSDGTKELDPTLVDGSPTWDQVSAGLSMACGHRIDGSLWCWGGNMYGQLGDGTQTSRPTPVQAGVGRPWATISTGWYETCAVATDGTTWCWGNDRGALGDGVQPATPWPRRVADGPWRQLAAGGDHGCALDDGGALSCWGDNLDGDVGDGQIAPRDLPTPVVGAATWSTVATSLGATCGLHDDRSLWCWGGDAAGQPDDGTFGPVPVELDGGPWSAVSGGWYHSCGIRADRTLWCWGDNTWGQLGDGTTLHQDAPEQIGTASDWASVAAGWFTSCGIKTDGTLWCWGSVPIVPDRPPGPPVQIGRETTWRAVAVGFSVYGIRTDGSLWRWGPGSEPSAPYQLSRVGTSRAWATIAGTGPMCATRTDGSLWCWGDNTWGQLGDGTFTVRAEPVPVPGSWRAAAGGTHHTCAIATDGSLWCWGAEFEGALGDGRPWRATPARVWL